MSAISDTMAVSITSSGGTSCIIEAMATFPTSMALQYDACTALLNLILQKENLVTIGSKHGINTIINCLCQFSTNVHIGEKVCIIVAAISSALPQALFVLSNHAIVNHLVDCMYQFPQSGTIQIACSEVLLNLSVNNFFGFENIYLGRKGIDRLCTAMTQHPDNSMVLEKASLVIGKIISAAQSNIMVDNSVGKQMIEFMGRHQSDVNIQVCSISVLFALSLNDRNNKAVIAGLGGISAIISTMQTHLHSPLIQEKGCQVLWSLCVLETNQVAVGEYGGIQVIVNSMKEHLAVVEVQTEALGALKALAALISNKDMIINCGGIDSIVETMLVHFENEKIIQSCFGTLSNISVNPYTNRVKVISRAELNAVVDSMGRFSLSENIQLYGCRLLRNYSFEPSNITLMKENELLPFLIESAAINFPSSCGERAQYLLTHIKYK